MAAWLLTTAFAFLFNIVITRELSPFLKQNPALTVAQVFLLLSKRLRGFIFTRDFSLIGSSLYPSPLPLHIIEIKTTISRYNHTNWTDWSLQKILFSEHLSFEIWCSIVGILQFLPDCVWAGRRAVAGGLRRVRQPWVGGALFRLPHTW